MNVSVKEDVFYLSRSFKQHLLLFLTFYFALIIDSQEIPKQYTGRFCTPSPNLPEG